MANITFTKKVECDVRGTTVLESRQKVRDGVTNEKLKLRKSRTWPQTVDLFRELSPLHSSVLDKYEVDKLLGHRSKN